MVAFPASVARADDRMARQQPSAALHGVVTTQSGTARLPGVLVTVTPDAGGNAVVEVSNNEGAFRVSKLRPGAYHVRPSLAGFLDVPARAVTLAPGQDLELNFALELEKFAESVSVTGQARDVPTETASAGAMMSARLADILPVKGDNFQALLPMAPGVVRGPDGRINMKGGRPTQTGLQVANASVTDPSTGSFGFELPLDALESVDVLPNPFASEYGRFSSGVVRLETRRGGDRWQATANAFIPIPCLKICDGEHWGVRNFDPRLMVGGPIVAGRLFLAQSVQAHYHRDMATSLPSDQSDTVLYSLDSFTRVDAVFSRHTMTTSLAVYPRNVDYVNVNTFNRQPVTANFAQRGYWVSVADTATISPNVVLESMFGVKRYNVDITAQGTSPMEVWPDRNDGNFFNWQQRQTLTIQGTSAVSVARKSRAGEHLFKFGADVLHGRYSGSSESHPVIVRRVDGTASWRIDFSGPSRQSVAGTDVAAFAQDRWRINDRLLVELGVRLDRNGVTGSTAVAPRTGVVVSLLPEGRAILRGGAGWFYERTPLNVAAFASFEQQTVTRFQADGITASAPPVRYTHRVSGPLETPSSLVWNVEFDYRVSSALALRFSELQRRGGHEYVTDPIDRGGVGDVQLSSQGHSTYRETELTLRYAGSDQRMVTATYVRSRSEADTNAFDEYFGNFRNPVIRPRQFSTGIADVPNRLVMSAVWPLPRHWTLSPLLEIRDGFPFTCIDENQAYVGAVNQCGRFPTLVSLDLNLTKTLTIRNRQVRIGFRSNHLLNNFTPRDAQTNVDSPSFGTFYNTIPRHLGFIVEISSHCGGWGAPCRHGWSRP